MKKFYFGGEDDGDEEDEGAEGFGMPSPAEFIAMSQTESPSRYLMEFAIRVCEKSMVWSFTSPEDKLSMITKVFRGLADLAKEYDLDAEI